MNQPFAIMVTSDQTDLMSAVEIAAQARAAGAVVQTPFAHTPTVRQIARAKVTASNLVMIICNDIVTIMDLVNDTTTVKTKAQAGNILAQKHAEHLGRRFYNIANDNPAQSALAV